MAAYSTTLYLEERKEENIEGGREGGRKGGRRERREGGREGGREGERDWERKRESPTIQSGSYMYRIQLPHSYVSKWGKPSH